MPQSRLFDTDRYEPVTLTMHLANVGKTERLETAVSLLTKNIRGEVISSRTFLWVGEEHDELPEAALSAVAAWLWGPDGKAPLRAMLLQRDSAKQAAKRRGRLLDL